MALHKVRNLSDADHNLVSKAVSDAEKTTDGEIVTIAATQSNDYSDIALIYAAIISFIAMSFTAFFPAIYLEILSYVIDSWDSEIGYGEFAWLITSIGALKFLGVWLIMQWRPLLFLLIPKWIKAQRVRARAVDLFRVGTESKTAGKTGILIYLSMAEHRAEIVADGAITSKVGAEKWGDAMAALIRNVKNGDAGKGMAEAVEQIGVILTEHFPKSENNPNELPDKLIEL